MGVPGCGTYLWEDNAWKDSAGCMVAGFLSLVSNEVSALVIALITIDRFLVLHFPFSNFRFEAGSAQVACFSVWTLGILLVGLPLLSQTDDRRLAILRSDRDLHPSAGHQIGLPLPQLRVRRDGGRQLRPLRDDRRGAALHLLVHPRQRHVVRSNDSSVPRPHRRPTTPDRGHVRLPVLVPHPSAGSAGLQWHSHQPAGSAGLQWHFHRPVGLLASSGTPIGLLTSNGTPIGLLGLQASSGIPISLLGLLAFSGTPIGLVCLLASSGTPIGLLTSNSTPIGLLGLLGLLASSDIPIGLLGLLASSGTPIGLLASSGTPICLLGLLASIGTPIGLLGLLASSGTPIGLLGLQASSSTPIGLLDLLASSGTPHQHA